MTRWRPCRTLDVSDTPAPGRLLSRVTGHFLPTPPARLGVAVSGGSDSLGLLALLGDWARSGGPALAAVTVDHGLRDGSAEEAALVAEHCAALNVPHDTLRWQGWDGRGNLPDRARRARYRLMAEWAQHRQISHVALGHTADDVAETLLMRLSRAAGVDGLAAMAPDRVTDKVTFCRPVRALRRAELQAFLTARGLVWTDDPTNADHRYDRTRARAALDLLAPLGISVDGLANVAGHLAEVRAALAHHASEAADRLVTFKAGDVLIELAGFAELPSETARRLMQAALRLVAGAEYGPRGPALQHCLATVCGARDGREMTLHGCLIRSGDDVVRIMREHDAVAGHTVPAGTVWDRRWKLDGPGTPGMRVGALGDAGLGLCPDWRATGLPRATLLASPSIWSGDRLVAAPLAGLANGWSATQIFDPRARFAALLSH